MATRTYLSVVPPDVYDQTTDNKQPSLMTRRGHNSCCMYLILDSTACDEDCQPHCVDSNVNVVVDLLRVNA